MRYAGLKYNDIVDTEAGIVCSYWCQGCHFRCKGCHNPQTWDFEGGYELPADIKGQIIKAISANGIQRNFSVLGGEPLCEENLESVNDIITAVRMAYPHIKIYLWTGYELKTLLDMRKDNHHIDNILNNIDVLIDGPFIKEKKDLRLKLRGSSNQQIRYKGIDF